MLFVTELNICSGIEVVITSTTGNRVVVKSGTRVRIPPTAPEKPERCHAVKAAWHQAYLPSVDMVAPAN